MNVSALYVSPGHNFFGHNRRPPGEHPTIAIQRVECVAGRGLRGDRFFDYRDNYGGQVTFFAEEVHAALLRTLTPPPRNASAYRRNVVTRGADLAALIGKEFSVQGVQFLGTGEAKPCYWMDHAVTPGAEAWLKGRGGLRAKILSSGELRVDCPPAAGLLLAGGRSRRMGRDKVELAWRGGTLGAHQAATLAGAGVWPLHLATRREQTWTPPQFRRIEDQTADGGALAGFVDAFTAIDAAVITTLAIDLPLIAADWLERISGTARDHGISFVPFHDGRYEPFAAAWHRSAEPALRAGLKTGDSLQAVCSRLENEGRLRSPELSSAEISQLANVNTPEDLARLGPV